MKCDRCKASIRDDMVHCPECGAWLEKQELIPDSGETAVPDAAEDIAKEKEGSKSISLRFLWSKLWAQLRGLPGELLKFIRCYPAGLWKVSGVVIAVLLIVAGVWSIVMMSIGADNGYYIKDGELYIYSSLWGTVQITNDLIGDDYDNESVQIQISDQLGMYLNLSDDGKTLFYIDNIVIGEPTVSEMQNYIESADLYCVDISSPVRIPWKIASGITNYTVNSEGDLVTYRKDGKLYQSNLVVSVRIAKDLIQWYSSEDGDTVMYFEKKDNAKVGTLYRKVGKGWPQKLSDKVSYLISYDADMSTLVYRTASGICMKRGNEKPVLVSSEGGVVGEGYEDGSLYYKAKVGTDKYSIWELIVDDWDGTACGEYSRQKIVEMLTESTVLNPVFTLEYFDGTDSVLISESARAITYSAEHAPVLVYMDMGEVETPRISLSEITATCENSGSYDMISWARDMIEEAWFQNQRYYVCVGDTIKMIDVENIYDIEVSPDGKTVYVGADYDKDSRTCSLYKISISENSISDPELVDQDLEFGMGEFLADDVYAYYKNYQDNACDLYINGTFVDSGVQYTTSLHWLYGLPGMQYCEETGMVYYLRDGEENAGEILMQYDGTKKAVVDEYIKQYAFTTEGQVMVLSGTGDTDDLWLWDGEQVTMLEKNITAVVSGKGSIY